MTLFDGPGGFFPIAHGFCGIPDERHGSKPFDTTSDALFVVRGARVMFLNAF